MSVIKNDVILKFNNSGSNRYSITFEYDRQEQVRVRTYNDILNEYQYITDFEFDGPTTLVFTGVVPDSFEIARSTDISQSYGTSQFSVFVPGSAIKASELNGNLELLRQAIEESNGEIDSNDDDISDIRDDLEQEIIDREEGDQHLQDQINSIEINIDQIENGSLDGRYVKKTGDNMTGVLRMGVNQIKLVQDPTHDLDAVNLRTLKLYLGIDPDNPDPDDDTYDFSRVDLTATGGETSIDSTMTLNANREFVYLNGVLLNPDTDYSINADGSTIDFIDSNGDPVELFTNDRISILNFTVDSVISRENITVVPGQDRYTTTLIADAGDLNITLNGATLIPSDVDYGLVNATTFVLNYAPLSGDILRVYNADCTRTINIAVDGETDFTVSEANAFDANKELVFLNGKLLTSTVDYIVSSGRFITLLQPTIGGDSVLIITP